MQSMMIQLVPSRWQLLAITMVAILCFSSVMVVELPMLLKAILSCVIAWRYWHWSFVQGTSFQPVQIKYSQPLGWSILQMEDVWEVFDLEDYSVVHPWLTVLYFSATPTAEENAIKRRIKRMLNRRAYFITPDRIDKDVFRKLRVLLIWGHSRKQL